MQVPQVCEGGSDSLPPDILSTNAQLQAMRRHGFNPWTLLQVGRVLPGPAGKLQELAAAGALQQATPQTLGLKPGSVTGLSSSQAATQLDAAFLSSSWGAAEARADEDAVAAGRCLLTNPRQLAVC